VLIGLARLAFLGLADALGTMAAVDATLLADRI
jgi:hypothetical protein